MKMFSLIVPIYNVEKYVGICLDSILNQTYKNYEIILVNDGTLDMSMNIVREHLKDCDVDYKIINQTNHGLSYARNIGLKHSHAKYIWYIDSDDTIEPNALEVLSHHLGNDIVCFNYNVNGKPYIINYHKTNRVPEKYLVNSSICAWNKIYKRDFLINNKLFFKVGILYEDIELIPTFILYTKRISFIEDVLYNYIIRFNSITTNTKFDISILDHINSVRSMLEVFQEHNQLDTYKEELETFIYNNVVIRFIANVIFYPRDIYDMCNKELKTLLKDYNLDWKHNKYIKQKSFFHKLFFISFDYNLYYVCKIMCIPYKK